MTDREGWDTPPPPRVESTPRWIRTSLGGQVVADSKRAMLHLAYGPPLLPDDRRPQLPGACSPSAWQLSGERGPPIDPREVALRSAFQGVVRD